MKQLKNKILIKVNRKLIFIISILMIINLNLFGQIYFYYYSDKNKLYHSTLKTEIIPSEYVFIEVCSNSYDNYYLYNLKTREKKLFYIDKGYYKNGEYYDINGNLTTNWTDTNMKANKFYTMSTNRYGEISYNIGLYTGGDRTPVDSSADWSKSISSIYKELCKAYKYSLTQPEIINKKDRGIYIFEKQGELFDILCFQNEYSYYYTGNSYSEENYDAKGRVIFNNLYPHDFDCTITKYSTYWGQKLIDTNSYHINLYITNSIYFQLDNKSFTKPTWNEFTNNYLNYIKKMDRYSTDKNIISIYCSKQDIKENFNKYKNLTDIKLIGFIPIEEFEYYLLAD